MTLILRDLPYFEDEAVFYRIASKDNPKDDLRVKIKAFQIPVRIRMSARDDRGYSATKPSFPAILDTGYNRTIVLSAYHLTAWAEIHDPKVLGDEIEFSPDERPVIRGFPARVFEGRCYICPNEPNTWIGAKGDPYPVGGMIYLLPAKEEQFRMPLIGMEAIQGLNRILKIDYRRQRLQL